MLAARQNTEVDGFVIDVPLFLKLRRAIAKMPCAWWLFQGNAENPPGYQEWIPGGYD